MKHQQIKIDDMVIDTIALDLNGTLSVKGKLVKGVKQRVKTLKERGINMILISGDQRGHAEKICKELKINFIPANSSEEKEAALRQLAHPEKIAAIGNARIDIGMFKVAVLSIATLQTEGIHAAILDNVDIIVPNINDALDLFIDENSLKATLKK